MEADLTENNKGLKESFVSVLFQKGLTFLQLCFIISYIQTCGWLYCSREFEQKLTYFRKMRLFVAEVLLAFLTLADTATVTVRYLDFQFFSDGFQWQSDIQIQIRWEQKIGIGRWLGLLIV